MAVDLKLGDRLAIIRDGVKKGLTPQQAMLQYQINKDGGYNNWKNQFKQSTGVDPDLDDTYNYEQFFKENPEAAKQLLLGKVSPEILEMYKTPQAIQREKQVLLQRQKGSINNLMDYSLYEKLINDYMNKSVNVSAYGGSINMFVGEGETAPVSEPTSTTNKDDNEITKYERFTQTELEPNKWRTQRLPDFIELTPEELQDIKNYVLEMAYKEDTNKPFRIFHIPKEVIVKYHPELENVSMQNPGFYIYEDEYQDALKNGKKYLRLKWLRESSKEGKLFDEWKKLRKMLYLYDTDRNYANFTDGDTLELEDNAEKNYNLLPNVVITYDKGTQQQILPQEEPEELEIEPIRSGSVAIEPDITKIVQVEDKKLPPLTPTENTLKYIDMSGTTGEELKAFNNNPLNTEGVPGGSSFGNSADGTRIPDVFNLYDNYNYNVPYEDFSTYQPEGYQYQPWNIYNLQSSGYVDIPNWNVQQIQDNGDDDKFLNFLNMLANIPQKSDNTDLLMTLLMLPKDYFADPYAGEHYTNTTNFYDVYNNDPYTKIQRESNGTPLYKSGGRINRGSLNLFVPGGYIEKLEAWKTPEERQNDYYLNQQSLNQKDFMQSLDNVVQQGKSWREDYNNWDYRDIEGDYPIATNVWTNNGRIPIYKISGKNMLKAFPDYTWNNGLTFDPNVNYYTIKNAKGLYALVPQGSYMSGLMDLSFERDKTLHPTNIAASDMTTLVTNVPTLYGIKQMSPKQSEELETTQQALLWLDNRSNWERQQAQNMYDLNAWQQRYNYWLNIENITRDRITRPFVLTNYVRGGLDAINGYDSFLGSFFDPNKHGMWVGPEGRAFLLNHPFVAGLLDFGVDALGAKAFAAWKNPNSLWSRNIRTDFANNKVPFNYILKDRENILPYFRGTWATINGKEIPLQNRLLTVIDRSNKVFYKDAPKVLPNETYTEYLKRTGLEHNPYIEELYNRQGMWNHYLGVGDQDYNLNMSIKGRSENYIKQSDGTYDINLTPNEEAEFLLTVGTNKVRDNYQYLTYDQAIRNHANVGAQLAYDNNGNVVSVIEDAFDLHPAGFIKAGIIKSISKRLPKGKTRNIAEKVMQKIIPNPEASKFLPKGTNILTLKHTIPINKNFIGYIWDDNPLINPNAIIDLKTLEDVKEVINNGTLLYKNQ